MTIKPKTIKAVLFDMDGVLLDSEIPAFDALRNTLEKKGVTLPLAALMERYTGMNSNAIYASLVQEHGFGQTVEQFRAEHYQISGNFYRQGKIEPMPGLIPFLEFLRQNNIRMAVVSSTGAGNVLAVLNRLALLRFFDAVVSGDLVEQTKPSPEGYRKAAAYLRAEPEECLVVEDSPIGIQAGKNAGITVAGYKGSVHVQDTTQADFEVASYDALRAWVRERIWLSLY